MDATNVDLVTHHADVLAALRSDDPGRAGEVMVAHVRAGLSRHRDHETPQSPTTAWKSSG